MLQYFAVRFLTLMPHPRRAHTRRLPDALSLPPTLPPTIAWAVYVEFNMRCQLLFNLSRRDNDMHSSVQDEPCARPVREACCAHCGEPKPCASQRTHQAVRKWCATRQVVIHCEANDAHTTLAAVSARRSLGYYGRYHIIWQQKCQVGGSMSPGASDEDKTRHRDRHG